MAGGITQHPGMRLVCMADTHLYHATLKVPDGDVLIHAGDLLMEGTLEELGGAALHLNSLPHRHKILVAGNHDVCFEETPGHARALLGNGITLLQDSGMEIDGVRFWGSPWQPAFGNWAFNLPRGAPLAEKWALIPDGTHVLITHGPPRGHGDRTGGERRAGCDDLMTRVRQVRPLLHLFGHIHEDGGVTHEGPTTFINCTTWECDRRPTVVDLRVVDGRVEVESVNAPP